MQGNAVIVPILSLAPAPYEPIRELKVVVEETSEGFTATLYDANIGATGETESEAIDGLKEHLVQIYEMLQRQTKLGPGPTRQLAVLRSLIAKKT
jgi:hypothetical protein